MIHKIGLVLIVLMVIFVLGGCSASDELPDLFVKQFHLNGAAITSVGDLTGATGATGSAGATGATGATGSAGATGATGATGSAGADGAPGANFTDYWTDIIHWNTLDGYNLTNSGGGTANINDSFLYMVTAGSSGWTSLNGKWYYPKLLATGKTLIFESVIVAANNTTTQLIEILLTTLSTMNPNSSLVTTPHMGFYVSGADVFYSNSDGTNQTYADTGVNMGAGEQFLVLRLVYEPGVDIKYYVNGSLINTINTNLPTTSHSMYFNASVKTTTASARDLMIGRVLLVRDY